MGLQMPAFAYYSAKGRPTKGKREGARDREDSKLNSDNQALLDKFFLRLRHPVLRDIAIETQAAYNNHLDLRKVDWRVETVVEFDIDYRPKLAALIETMDGRGTIVIPNYRHHLRDGNAYCLSMLSRLCKSSIAPVSIDDLTSELVDLELACRHPARELRRSSRFKDEVVKFFNAATVVGINNRDKLNSHYSHRPNRARDKGERKAGATTS